MQSNCCIEDTSEPCGPFLDLQADNIQLRKLLSNAKAVMLCAGLPRRGIDDIPLMLAFYTEIDDALRTDGEDGDKK